MSILDQQIRLAGRPCVLIQDEIRVPSTDEAVLLQDETGEYPEIWVSDHLVEKVRGLHAKTPIFGLWQTLIINGVVDPQERLYAYYTAASKGAYLYSADGETWTSSGRFVGDTPPQIEGVTIEEAIEVDDKLVTGLEPPDPQYAARTRREIARLRDKASIRRRRVQVMAGAAGLVAAVLVVAAYLGLSTLTYAADRSKFNSLTERADRAEMQVMQLRQRRAVGAINAGKVKGDLSRINWLIANSDRVIVPEVIFNDRSTRTIKAFTVGIREVPPWTHVATPQPTGVVLIEWAL